MRQSMTWKYNSQKNGGNIMYSDWIVKVRNEENGRVFSDKFPASRRSEAIHAFKECYRHGTYTILEVTEGEPYKD